jgi:ceramide glucosyltransferase
VGRPSVRLAGVRVRRETPTAIGGFEAIADQLADHYRLGELTHRLRMRKMLSRHSVTTDVLEVDPKSLFEREVRWLRTIRLIQQFFRFPSAHQN